MQIRIRNLGDIPREKLQAGNGREFDGQAQRDSIAEPFPTDEITGNDDTDASDEDSNPYVTRTVLVNLNHSRGEVAQLDRPRSVMIYYGEAEGTQWEELNFFREFVRLQINDRWYRVSDWLEWHFHFRVKVRNNRWVDDGSEAGPGFGGYQ